MILAPARIAGDGPVLNAPEPFLFVLGFRGNPPPLNPDFSSIFHHLQVVACYRIKSSSTFPLTWQKTLAYVENAIPVALIGDGELG